MSDTRMIEVAGEFGRFGRIVARIESAGGPRPFVVVCEATEVCWLKGGQDEATLEEAKRVAEMHVLMHRGHSVRIEDTRETA